MSIITKPIRWLNRYIVSKRRKRHEQLIFQNCVTGKGFCESAFYPSRSEQLMNIKIRNKTGSADRIVFGDHCNVSVKIFLNHAGSITAGDFLFVNGTGLFRIDHHLKIGSHVFMGPDVKLWDTKSHPLSPAARRVQSEDIALKGSVDSYEAGGGDIVIEDDVWLGMDVTVLGGVTIGRGSVVATGSIVTKDVPPFTLVAGVPAKEIRSIDNDLLEDQKD